MADFRVRGRAVPTGAGWAAGSSPGARLVLQLGGVGLPVKAPRGTAPGPAPRVTQASSRRRLRRAIGPPSDPRGRLLMNDRFPRGAFDFRMVRLPPWKVWLLVATGGALALALT